MYYITVKQSPKYHQMSLEEFLFGSDSMPREISQNLTGTRTYAVETVSDRFRTRVNVDNLMRDLANFNRNTENLREADRHSLYREFYIPKKKGGLRKISAPDTLLMGALRELKGILERYCPAFYHTSAFAYVPGRCTVDAVKKHQMNESRWFAKFDLHDFFGSTTPEFVMRMLSMIFPFCFVMENERGKQELETALSLAFLDGGLPQGTPLSPLLTNLIMIPIDYTLANTLRDYDRHQFVYTRYADDMNISCEYTFRFRGIEELIYKTFLEFGAPFQLNREKTHYGSIAGSNYMLGVILNKDNEITVGSARKRQFRNMLENFVRDSKGNTPWDLESVQTMEGLRSYYTMVEGDTINRMLEYVNKKYDVNVMSMIKQALR